jgi:hypothetical protein
MPEKRAQPGGRRGRERTADSGPQPFEVKDCALIRLSTGLRAQNLREFLLNLRQAPAASIYHHFWGRFLDPTYDEPEYGNDFSGWAARGLNDRALAERLAAIDPGAHEDLEGLRQAVIDAVEARLDETEMVPWAKADQQFCFIWSQMIIFGTGRVVKKPRELGPMVASLSTGSIFYHFLDARRRPPLGDDDFTRWLRSFAPVSDPACAALRAIEPNLTTLPELRHRIAQVLAEFLPEESP